MDLRASIFHCEAEPWLNGHAVAARQMRGGLFRLADDVRGGSFRARSLAEIFEDLTLQKNFYPRGAARAATAGSSSASMGGSTQINLSGAISPRFHANRNRSPAGRRKPECEGRRKRRQNQRCKHIHPPQSCFRRMFRPHLLGMRAVFQLTASAEQRHPCRPGHGCG